MESTKTTKMDMQITMHQSKQDNIK